MYNTQELNMDLGTFSISLTVKDIETSRVFYEKFGFSVFHGDASQNWLILKEWRSYHRPVSGHVRTEHSHFQSGLG